MRIELIVGIVALLHCISAAASPQQRHFGSICASNEYALSVDEDIINITLANVGRNYGLGIFGYIDEFFGNTLGDRRDEIVIFQDVSCLPSYLDVVVETLISMKIIEYGIIATATKVERNAPDYLTMGVEFDRRNFGFGPGKTVGFQEIVELEGGLILLRRHNSSIILKREDVSGISYGNGGKYSVKLSNSATLIGRCMPPSGAGESICHLFFWLSRDGLRVDFQVSLLGGTYRYAKRVFEYYEKNITAR